LKSPKVSVCITTYNHERFIEEAVRSALEQKTDFPFEVVVGDDHSTDATPEILLRLREEHPERLRLIMRRKNIGSTPNFTDTYFACRGEYIALLDGDDFWSCDDKLSRQVCFLDAHPDVVLCGHRVAFIYDDDETPENLRSFLGDVSPIQKAIGGLQDALEIPAYIPTRSRVFRRAALQSFPDWYYDVVLGDWAMLVLLAQKGKLAMWDDVMAVQRIHRGGLWSGMPEEDQVAQLLRSLRHYRRVLGKPYRRYINRRLGDCHLALARWRVRRGRRREAVGLVCRGFGLHLLSGSRPHGVRQGLGTLAMALRPAPVVEPPDEKRDLTGGGQSGPPRAARTPAVLPDRSAGAGARWESQE